jgi:hypothetical protein
MKAVLDKEEVRRIKDLLECDGACAAAAILDDIVY